MGYDHRHRKHGDEFSAFFHRTGGTKNDTERFGFHFVGLYTYTYIKTYIHFRRRKRIKETVRRITAILISEHLHNGNDQYIIGRRYGTVDGRRQRTILMFGTNTILLKQI